MTARRVRLVAFVLALFVAIVVFAPQLPPVRAWLLERGQEALARQGYVVAYDRSAGNPWSGIRLFDAEVTGPGVDVSVERLRVGWFLPSLLASELPLSIAIDGLRGDVDVSEFPTADGGTGGLPITPVLEEVIVQDVALTVNDAPFTIPDLTLADLRLEQVDARFAFETEVRTGNGSLTASGEIGLAPFTLAADVSRADITLARHWWNGASGGTAQGTVRVDGDGVRADLEVQDGALDWLGLDGRDISGPVRYRHPVVTGELTGTVLGGAVTADANVDIGARRWQGTLTGAAGLPEAAGWITRNMAFDPEVLELTGDASYTLNAVGWTTVTLEGDAAGAGAVRGMNLDDLAADIRYTSGEGVAVDATGDLAGGDIMANVASTGAGIRVRAGASGVDLGPARVSTADLDLTFTPEGPRGDGSLAVTASVLERDASVTVDLAADAEGLQFFAEGSAGAAAFTGATVLDGRDLEGGARIVGLAPEVVSGAPVVAASWSGPRDALALEIEIQGDQPVQPQFAGIGVDVDLRGRAAGTVTDLRAYDLTGAFGALEVAATGDLQSGTVTASLAEAPVTGRVQTRASLPAVSIAYDRNGFMLDGRLEHDVLTAAGVTLEPAAWTVDGTLGANTVITADAVDAGATVVWRPPALSVSLDGLRATVAERSATLEGDLSVVPSEGLGTVRGDLTATLPEGSVTIAADRDLEVDARLPAGFRAGPVALAEPLDLTGAFDPDAGTLAASGTVGAVTLDVRADLSATPSARIDVQSGEEQLMVTLGDGGLTAQGRLEVGPVARAFGFEASGTVSADLGVQDGRYVGSAQIEAVAPVPFEAELVGAGDAVRATVSATLGGQRIALAGTVVPALRLEGAAGPLEGVVIDGSTLAGSGSLPSLAIGPVTVPSQPWDLQGSLADGRAVLVAGASTLTATWSDGLDVRAEVTQPLVLGSTDATLFASATWSPASPEGAMEGALELAPGAADAGAEPLATFRGSLEGGSFEVLAAAGTLARAFGAQDVVRGDVRLAGRFDPETVSVEADGAWTADSEVADLTIAYASEAGLRATVETDGVTVAWTPDALTVGGVDGDLAPFLHPALLASVGLETLEISGRLQRANGLWSGTVDVDTGIPGSSVTVTGVEERLLADARLAFGDGAVQASGAVLPDVSLSLSGGFGPLTLTVVLSGPYDDLAVDAAIELEPARAGPVALDGTRIAVQGTVSPLELRLSGPGTDARISAAGPTGAITLQGLVAGESQTARVDLSGTLAEPVARAELAGPVSGTVSVSPDGARATLAVAADAIPGAVPIHGPVRVNATADASLAWQADVRADASISGATVIVSANVAGERLAYSGQGRIATDVGTVAGLSLRGQGAAATLVVNAAELESGALDPLLPVDHALAGTGRLEVRTSPFAVTGGVGLEGTLGDMPTTVAVTLSEGAGLDLSARAGPVAITAQSADLQTIAIRVASDGAAGAMPNTPTNALSNTIPDALVDAEVRLREATIEIAGTGTFASEPLTIGATWWRSAADEGSGRPRLAASVRSTLGDLGLELAGPVSPASDWTVAVDVHTDAGPLPAGATLEGTLDTAGPTAPTLRLGGDLSLTDRGLAFEVDLAAQPNLVLVSLEAAGLVMRASAGSGARPGASDAPVPDAPAGFRLWDVAVSGAGTLDVAGVAAAVDATEVLTWSPDEGFGGSARIDVQAPELTDRLGGAVALGLQGDEGLTVTLAAPANLATGTLRLSRAPWSDRPIEGALQIDIPSTSLASWPLLPTPRSSDLDAASREASASAAATPTTESMDAFAAPDLPGLEASIEITGELDSPRAQGTLQLTGSIEADGSLRYVDGAGRVDLAGADLDVLARADAAGWLVEATLDGADLGALPLASPRVSGRIQADGGWTGLERATLTGVEVQTAGGTISAEGSLADEVAVALRVDLPLRDLETGPDLVGRVRGPVVVRMPSLDAWTQADVQAALDLDGFGVASIGGRLAGDVGVSGTWPDLAAYAHLEGTDGATGTLDLDADLAESRLDVESTLAWAGIQADLRVDVTSDAWTAAGTLAYRDLGLRLGTENGAIALEGLDGLAGWRGGIDPAEGVLDATGPVESPLAALVPGAPASTGTATVRARIAPSPAATVRVEGLTVAGLPWGDLQATFAGLDAPIEIEGTYVDARVALGGTSVEGPDGQTSEQADGTPETHLARPSWSLVLTDLPVLPDARLSANAQGAGTDLRGSATLSGTHVDAPLALAVDVSLDEVWRVRAEGRALGGTVDVDAQRAEPGAWTGAVELGGMTLAGSTLTLEGVLAGSDLVPTLVADTSIAGAVHATGTLQASRDVLDVDQRLSVPAVGRDVSVQGRLWPAIDATVHVGEEGDTGEALRLQAGSWSEPLSASGATTARVAGFEVRVAGGADRPGGGALRVQVDAPLEGLRFTGALAREDASVLDILDTVRTGGIVLAAEGRAAGTLAVTATPLRAVLHDLRYEHPSGVEVALAGPVSVGDADLTGTLGVPELDFLTGFEGLPVDAPLPVRVTGIDGEGYALSLVTPAGTLGATYRLGGDGIGVIADLALGGGNVQADLTVSPAAGVRGDISVTQVTVPTAVGAQPLVLDGTVRGVGSEVEVALRGAIGGSTAQANGVWSLAGIVPNAWLPDARVRDGGGRRSLELRLRSFDPTTLPAVAGRVPNLTVPLSGVLTLEPNQVFGRVVAPELRVADETLPLSLDVTGTFAEVLVQGTLGRSTIQLTAGADAIEGYMRLESFPSHLGIEALVGDTDVSAEVTGVLRGTLSLGGEGVSELRLATERIRLERDGVVTTGNVAISWIDGVLTVEEAEFEGVGTYRASGVIRPNELDFSLRADEADFGPLLGLVPTLAQLSTDASGTLVIDATGSLGDPRIDVTVSDLAVEIAGGSYRIPTAQVDVTGTELSIEGVVEGLAPIDGRVPFAGGGRIEFVPFRLGRVELGLGGRAAVPALGEVSDLDGTVAFGGGEPPRLDLVGSVGNPLRVSGTLAPLDLRIQGDDLAVRSPTFLLASSVLDINASLIQERGSTGTIYVVRGGVFADQARFELGIREVDPSGTRERNPALERVVFDSVQIQAPRQLQLTENFGTLEGRADLTLVGTAATPNLVGRASAVRGNVRFFGRDFTLLSAEAVFDRTRGIYPSVSLEARTTADKSRVLAGISDTVRFVVPREGGSFEIDLAISGEVEPTPQADRAFRVQVETELSSDARIEVQGESAIASGPRSLLDSELLAVITLGRLEINPNLAAEQGVASAVAGTALDTVVDYLVVSELQRGLSEALGVDVVEIRTSNLSQVFTGDGQDPFSVSFRLGGYLTEDLFASYRIGRFDDASATLGLTNEVRFTYELGPVAFDLAGSVGFEATGTGAPVPGLSAAVRYEITPLIDLETSVDLSNAGSRARFGVTLRW